MLRTFVLTLHHDAGGQVGNTDRRVGGVNVRAAEVAKRQQAEASTRRNLLGSGDRSDRNRTYNC
jgi:protein subunit release factor A